MSSDRLGAAPREQPTPPRPPVAIKGRGDGLRVIVAAADAADIERSLGQQLEQRAGAFFADATVTLELPPGPLDLALAGRLAAIVAAAGMRVTTVSAGDSGPNQGRTASEPARGRTAQGVGTQVHATQGSGADGTLLVHRTVRGGQRLASAGTVVVFGDVNPGAEVLAGGSVIVWGRLRGVVEAGLAEPPPADVVVCALDLAPTQLRIGSALARAPEEPERVPVPEIARAVDGRIVVEAWR